MPKEKRLTRNGYVPIKAFDPYDPEGEAWDLLVSCGLERKFQGQIFKVKELAITVAQTILKPIQVCSGLRDDFTPTEQSDEWLCYISKPGIRFVHVVGKPGKPNEAYPQPTDRLFMVFVNEKRVIYNWRWEMADHQNPNCPIDDELRFDQVLWKARS